MRVWILSALVALCLGCGGAQKAVSAPQPRAVARATVTLAVDAWNDSGSACMAVADAKDDDSIRQSCLKALLPMRDDIIAAGNMANAWDAAAQSNFPCAIQHVLDGLLNVDNMLAQVGAKAPPVLAEAVDLAKQFAPQCVAGK